MSEMVRPNMRAHRARWADARGDKTVGANAGAAFGLSRSHVISNLDTTLAYFAAADELSPPIWLSVIEAMREIGEGVEMVVA